MSRRDQSPAARKARADARRAQWAAERDPHPHVEKRTWANSSAAEVLADLKKALTPPTAEELRRYHEETAEHLRAGARHVRQHFGIDIPR